jgi:hypothetical protein
MLDIKGALIGDGNWDTEPTGIWTVNSSSDATTADATDNWSVIGDLTWDNPGDAHSWIVFDTPLNAGNAQFLIDLDGGGVPNQSPEQSSGYFSWGGGFSGGTTNDRPTASDEQLISDYQFSVSIMLANQFGSGIDMAWNMTMSSDGEEVRFFLMTLETCVAFWGFGRLDEPASSEDWWATTYSSGNNTTEILQMEQDGDEGFLRSEFPVVPSITSHGGGHVITGQGARAWCMFEGVSFQLTEGGLFNVANINVAGELYVWGLDPFAEANAFGPSPNQRGPKGRIKDMWVVTDYRPVGATYPQDGSRQFHQQGKQIIIPWDGSIPKNRF